MKTVSEYTVIVNGDVMSLARIVNKKLTEGWQPYGTMYITGGNTDVRDMHGNMNIPATYHQVMVKYDGAENTSD